MALSEKSRQICCRSSMRRHTCPTTGELLSSVWCYAVFCKPGRMQYCSILIAARHNTPVIRQWATLSGPRTMIFEGISQSFRWALDRSTVERILKRCFSAGERMRCYLRRLFGSMMGILPLVMMKSLMGFAS